MTKVTHDYHAVVRRNKQGDGDRRITAAQVVHANNEHWDGFAEAGATLDLAVGEITKPYVETGVKPATVAREFNRIHGSWKEFRKDRFPVPAPTSPVNGAPPEPAEQVSIPPLNDNRLTGGMVFGGQA